MEKLKWTLGRNLFSTIAPAVALVGKKQFQQPSLNREFRLEVVPMISLIIPAHNEEAYLRRTLDSLNQQDYPCFEIIVIANGCTDGTAAVARERSHRLFVTEQKGLSRARNLGARLARGELLVFLDADTELAPGALAVIAREFTRENAAGTLRGAPDHKRLIYSLIYILKNFMHRWALHEGSSGVILGWKEDFDRTAGFDEALQVCEISDLIQKLRGMGTYKFIDGTTATTSMRRYENGRLLHAAALWLKIWLRSMFRDLRGKNYEAVR